MAADTRPVVFCRASNRIIDWIRSDETDARAFARLAEYGTALTVLPCNEAMALYEAQFILAPVAITAAEYHNMLGVLPPLDWQRTEAGESFKMSELTAGTITAIYARIEGRHFHLSDSMFTRHDEIISRVRASPAFLATAARTAPENQR